MDRIIITNEAGETVMDASSNVYTIVAICPDDKALWTRNIVEVAGGIHRTVLDPLQLAARLSICVANTMTVVKEAIKNAELPLDADELMRDMVGVILKREAEEMADA